MGAPALDALHGGEDLHLHPPRLPTFGPPKPAAAVDLDAPTVETPRVFDDAEVIEDADDKQRTEAPRRKPSRDDD